MVTSKHGQTIYCHLAKVGTEQSVNQISEAVKVGNGQVNVALRELISDGKVERREISREEHGINTGKLPHVYKARPIV